MKSWVEGHLNNIAAINELQRVLNQGLAPRMKQMVRQMIRQMEMTGDDERLEKFHAILRDIPKLWAAYRHEPLKSRLGSNSAQPFAFLRHGPGPSGRRCRAGPCWP